LVTSVRRGQVFNDQGRRLVGVVVSNVDHPKHLFAPKAIVSPGRQFGTAAWSVGGSAGVPSSRSSL
jgi:hypothetical protein